MSDSEINYAPPPTLARMFKSDAQFRCIMGPLGSGKSSGCNIELLLRAFQQEPGEDGVRRSRWAVVRNTYGQLRDTTRKTFEQWVPSDWGTWNEQQFTFRIQRKDRRWGEIDAEILFRALNRPEDIKKLLSLDLTGAYVNEVREVPIAILDGLDGRIGRYPPMADGGPTWWGIWADTNPWHANHPLAKRFRQGLTGYELFRQPGGRAPDAENSANLPPGYYERLCNGKPQDWVRVYVDGEEASAGIGSIYGDLLDALQRRKAVADFTHEKDGILTSWDLGISDSTAIWWWRVHEGAVDFLDHYEAHGKPLSHFFDVVDARQKEHGWTYVKHWLPHDAMARTLATGTTIYEQCVDRWRSGMVDIVPKVSLLDGIQALRWLLEQPGMRFHARCDGGFEALREYRYAYDEETRDYSKRPVHDWASHSSDAARYAAVVFRYSDAITRKPVPEVEKPPARDIGSFTFKELMEKPRNRGGRRI